MSERSEGQAVVPVAVVRTPVVPRNGTLAPLPGTPIRECPTNLDLATEEGQCLAVRAAGEADVEIPAGGEVLFPTRHYLITAESHVDEVTGEEHQYPRLVLIGADGRTLVTTSVVVPRRLHRIIELLGPGPWEPALRLVVSARLSRRTKRVYHDLQLASPKEVQRG